jgi:hypothetical protein
LKVLIEKMGVIYMWVVDCIKGDEVQGEACENETGKTN